MLIDYKYFKTYQLYGAEIEPVGFIKDIYFDDLSWKVRYFVVDVGRWLSGRKILISTESVRDIDRLKTLILTKLTRDQIKNSPLISEHEPVSRQHEIKLATHYGWPDYWNFNIVHGIEGITSFNTDPYLFGVQKKVIEKNDSDQTKEKKADSHLRSFAEVVGYTIEATDGDLGHVEDFLIKLDNWKVDYLVINTRNWLPGDKVVVETKRICDIDLASKTTSIDLDRNTLKTAPTYEPSYASSDIYEKQLKLFYDYLDRYSKKKQASEKNLSSSKDHQL